MDLGMMTHETLSGTQGALVCCDIHTNACAQGWHGGACRAARTRKHAPTSAFGAARSHAHARPARMNVHINVGVNGA